jgi:hypothetical protein
VHKSHNGGMEAHDLEVGPIQQTFESMFWRIGQYFQNAAVVPEGKITETGLNVYKQDSLRSTLNALLSHYGFSELPYYMRIISDESSKIDGIHRSDNISTYEEKWDDGSLRTFNFYSTFGPENMKTSFYWLNLKSGGEQINGILTMDDRWYFRIITTENNVFYQRMERQKPQW